MSEENNNNNTPNLSKLERLKARQKEIKAQIAREQNREKSKERKSDTRRKIIMGALALSHMSNDAEFRAVCERLQREGIKGDADRLLFNLSPLPAKSVQNNND